MAKKIIEKYSFTTGAAGVGTLRFPGRYSLERVLLIINTTRNTTLYNFADSSFSGTAAAFTTGDLAGIFPYLTQSVGGYTTVTLDLDTTAMNAADKIAIYVDEPTSDAATTVRPGVLVLTLLSV